MLRPGIVAAEVVLRQQREAGEILDSIDIPVKIIGADPTVAFSFLPGVDLSTLAVLDYDFIPDTTHLL